MTTISSICPTLFRSPKLITILAVVALIFGTATIFSGGQVLFGSEQARISAGDYVPVVLWFNFLAGFAYVVAAFGLFRRANWGAHLALAIAVATAMTFAGFAVYIYSDGAYETRTLAAMTLRTGVWAFIAFVARQSLLRKD